MVDDHLVASCAFRKMKIQVGRIVLVSGCVRVRAYELRERCGLKGRGEESEEVLGAK
jgi:hypothetical protein